MNDQSDLTASNVNINSNETSLAGDVVGRDKIIHNIVIVGQLLDFAGVQGILPPTSHLPNYATVEEAVKTLLNDTQSVEMSQAISFAGAVLGDTFSEWRTSTTTPVIPVKMFLPQLAQTIARKLAVTGHWAAASEEVIINDSSYTVLWLYSLQELLKKTGYKPTQYGIACLTSYGPDHPKRLSQN